MVAQLCPLRIWRALPLTEDSPLRDEIPEFAHIYYIESRCPLYAGRGVFAARASAKKGPQLWEKSRGPSGAVIQIGSTRSMKLHAVRAYFIRHHNLLHHSKDSLQAHFIPGFFSGHLNRIDRSCAVAISALDQICGSRSGDVRSSAALSKRAESHRNKTNARPVS
jgi:hypothetical protein